MSLRGFLLFSALVVAGSSPSPAVQPPSTSEKVTILEIFQNASIIKSCSSALIDPRSAAFLDKCNVTVPEKRLTEDNYKSFLCMAYYDVVLKICDRSAKDELNFRIQLPKNKSDVDDIIMSLDETRMAEDFCKKNHLDMGQTEFDQTKEYVQILSSSLSEPELCQRMCVNWERKLNPFCKIILWATSKLNDHRNSTDGYEKLGRSRSEHLAKTSTVSKEVVSTNLPKLSAVSVSAETTPIKTVALPSSVKEQSSPISAPVDDHRDAPLAEKEKTAHHSDTGNVSHPLSPPVGDSNKPSVEEMPKAKEVVQSLPTAQAAPPPVPKAVEQPPPPAAAKPKEDEFENIPLEDNKKPESPLDSQGADDQIEDTETRVGGDSANNLISKTRDMENAYDDDQDIPAKVDFATGAAGGAAPVENPTIVEDGSGYSSSGKFIGAEDSHFFLYFLFASGVLILGYIIFHNKNKVLGLLLEGRKGEGRRRCAAGGPAYRKLDCTLEEAVSSAPPSHTPHIVY